ncbi:MAG: hypothetical protein P1U54_14860 [Immundisolibacteraceae bacterium]|nr:hypothetical protein [Immundisolibacteraceae bacterium]
MAAMTGAAMGIQSATQGGQKKKAKKHARHEQQQIYHDIMLDQIGQVDPMVLLRKAAGDGMKPKYLELATRQLLREGRLIQDQFGNLHYPRPLIRKGSDQDTTDKYRLQQQEKRNEAPWQKELKKTNINKYRRMINAEFKKKSIASFRPTAPERPTMGPPQPTAPPKPTNIKRPDFNTQPTYPPPEPKRQKGKGLKRRSKPKKKRVY